MAHPADSERKWFKTLKLISATWEMLSHRKKKPNDDNLNIIFTFQPLKVTDLDC